jgi:hypothetical protein
VAFDLASILSAPGANGVGLSVGSIAGGAIDKILQGGTDNTQQGGNELGLAIAEGIYQKAAPVIAILVVGSVVLVGVAVVWSWKTVTR